MQQVFLLEFSIVLCTTDCLFVVVVVLLGNHDKGHCTRYSAVRIFFLKLNIRGKMRMFIKEYFTDQS